MSGVTFVRGSAVVISGLGIITGLWPLLVLGFILLALGVACEPARK